MKRLLSLVAFFATVHASAQQVNPVPDYVFANRMSAGRNTVTDTAAYFSIGPRYGATRGMMPPMVVDTASFSGNKRNGLLIFSVQKNKFLYWDSVRVQWSDMAGSSGTYITGSGITGYVPQFNGTTTIDTSALFTLGNRLGVGSSTFAYTSTSTANVELNGTAGGILGFKRNDSARGYLWHTGSDMELANTTAGTLSFNTNSATRGSISSAGVWRLHNLAGTGDRVVQASSNGTLSATTSVTGLVDTLTLSTRAWRQKGIDSVAGLSRVGGSGTTNYVAKFTAGTTIGNSIIQDNGTDVGIGSNSAGARLEILRTATGAANNNTTGSVFGSLHGSGGGPSAYGFAIRHNGSAYAGISGSNFVAQLVSSSTNSNALEMYTTGSTPLVLGTSATERLRITSGGNVGIGTQNPAAASNYNSLTINGTNGSWLVLNSGDVNRASFEAQATQAFLSTITSIPLIFRTNATEAMRIFANGRVGINTTTDAGYQLDVNGTLRSVNGANFATTSGNVGIGTASPNTKLSVVGNVDFRNAATGLGTGYGLELSTNSNTPRISLVDNGVYTGEFFSSSSIVGIKNVSNNALTFGTNNTERGRINSAGEWIIDASGTDAGDYKLQVSGNIYNTGSAVLAATSGNVGIGTASPLNKLHVEFSDATAYSPSNTLTAAPIAYFYNNTSADAAVASTIRLDAGNLTGNNAVSLSAVRTGNADAAMTFGTRSGGGSVTERARITSSGELLINTTTDAGDYKLQVVGNARVGTGKLDIASNTTFGIGVARSGTSEVAGQIYNSNGILYTGVESSAGGQIFTGSSAYAAVIGSGANYPLQFATNNATRATINTNGELLINTLSDQGDYKLQVNGSVYNTGQVTRGVINAQGTGAQVFVDSTTNLSSFAAFQSLSGSNISPLFSGNVTWNTTGNVNGIDLYVTNTASGANSNFMQLGDGTNNFKVTKDAGIITANPTSGTARKWKLGSVVATSVQLDTSNYVEVEINGTFYRLAIVTPL